MPEPDGTREYIATRSRGSGPGTCCRGSVRDLASDTIVGSTRYHDIVTAVDRVEIGYTWYGASWQRTHVNTACKLLLLGHAFDTLGCAVVGLRTDNFNFASQAAIAALGAKKDGVLRHHQARRDGTVRDTVMFSILAERVARRAPSSRAAARAAHERIARVERRDARTKKAPPLCGGASERRIPF